MQIRIVNGVVKIKFVKMQEEGILHLQTAVITMGKQKHVELMAVPIVKRLRLAVKKSDFII